MSEIIRKIGELEVSQRKKDGFINATQLCKAYERKTGILKRPNNWFETDRANRLIEVVSDQTGLEVTELFIVIHGGRENGSWIHPDLSVPFASWLSAEFEYMVSKWVLEWVTVGKTPVIRSNVFSSQIEKTEPTIEEINTFFEDFKDLGLDPVLLKSAKCSAVAKAIPRLALVAEEGKKLLAAHMEEKEIPISPTELGQEIARELGLAKAPSGRKVNVVLMECGFQNQEDRYDSKGKKKTEWRLTELGERHGKLVMDTARGHAKTVHCVRWNRSVISLIQDNFIDNCNYN